MKQATITNGTTTLLKLDQASDVVALHLAEDDANIGTTVATLEAHVDGVWLAFEPIDIMPRAPWGADTPIGTNEIMGRAGSRFEFMASMPGADDWRVTLAGDNEAPTETATATLIANHFEKGPGGAWFRQPGSNHVRGAGSATLAAEASYVLLLEVTRTPNKWRLQIIGTTATDGVYYSFDGNHDHGYLAPGQVQAEVIPMRCKSVFVKGTGTVKATAIWDDPFSEGST